MAGNARYELTSASPESSFSGNFQNGQRATLDRSSNFRECAENRVFGFGKPTVRGSATSSDSTALSQCLMLDPIFIGDRKNTHSADLRRVLGFSVASGLEDNSFGTAYLKNSLPVSVEELKRLRASVADTCVKACGRAKRIDEHMNKLNKYVDVMSPKKQQRHELMANERSTGPTLKIGSQIHRNSSELGNQKLDDRSKNVVLNKRARTSVTETRADSRNNGVPRPSLVAKERELLKYNTVDSDMAEGKMRRLPASGEGWVKKIKRKRSVGTVCSRSIDSDGALKKTMTHKLTNESNVQATDSSYGFRSGTLCAIKKLDSASPVGSSPRTALKNDQEKSALSKNHSLEPNKERAFMKGNVKLNNLEDNNTICSSQIVKGKASASRAPRSSSTIPTNASSNIPRVHGTLESWEQPQGISKGSLVGGTNNRKRAVPSASSSPPITQWGSQGSGSHKITQARRTNLIPVSNQDEAQLQFEEFSPASFGPRLGIGGANTSFLSRSADNGNQSFKVKPENVTSPAILSESEESGACEIRIKDIMRDVDEKGVNACQHNMPYTVPMENNTDTFKNEIGDGVRRKERSGRGPQFPRGNSSSLREKVENSVPTKPMRNAKSGSDKNGKSGRRLKKLSERRGFPRFSHLANGASPDCSGESEDDHEELLEAANLSCNSSLTACSSEFWKNVELLFASVSPDEKEFLSLQLKVAEESCGQSSYNCSSNNLLTSSDDYGHEEIFASDTFSSGRNSCTKNENRLKNSLDKAEFLQHLQNSSLHCPNVISQHRMSIPLYQRVLSALIVEVDIEESEETGFGRPWSSANDAHLHIGSESGKMDRLKFHEPIHGAQTRENGNPGFVFPCNGNIDFDRSTSARDRLCSGELMQRGDEYILSKVEVSVHLSDYIPQNFPANNSISSPTEYRYEQMSMEEKIALELQSIGLFQSIPDLDDKEDEAINQEICQLERELQEVSRRKKTSLDKIYKAVQEFKNDGRCDPVQAAMDKLVELAYNKLLATLGSFASKHGISRVPKQVALAFMKRTLARCRKFEDSGVSCFTEPAFQEIIYSTPPRFNDPELLAIANLGTSNDGTLSDAFATSAHQSDHIFAKNGSVSHRGKKKEVLLDDVVGTAAFSASSALGTLGGGPKGKRSERDSSTRNAVAKSRRSAMAGSKGDQKTKVKPKPKTAQLRTPGNEFVSKPADHTAASGGADSDNNEGARRRQDVRFKSTANIPPVVSSEDKTNLGLKVKGMEEELGIDSEVGVPPDFNSWFSFDVEGGQENDFVGLSVPMDELADIF